MSIFPRLYLLLLFGLLSSSGAVLAAPPLAVSHAVIREAPPGLRTNAAYAHLENNSNKTIIVHTISSDSFASIEMHLSRIVNGIATMQAQPELRISAGETAILQPGAYHLMLLNAQQALRDGDRVTLTLHTTIGDIHAVFGVKRF